MLNSLPVRLLWHSLNWLTRLTIIASGLLAVLLALAIIVLRYWMLPNIEQYHEKITTSLSAAIGSPVKIGKIEGDWQSWRPRLSFNDVRILDAQGEAKLVLPRIENSVSWLSLLTAELRFASIEVDRPELLIRRDINGQLFIGGVALLQQKNSQENNLADWLLHQSHMVARDALVVWVDEQRDAPPLVLRQVNLHIESLFSHHQFALRALPPSELATPLDVRGDFYGKSFDNLTEWRGQFFTQLDYTDVTAWRSWLNLPSEFSQGRGALRGWLGIENGHLAQITADLDLRDVVTKLAADVPEMALNTLRGRATWQALAGGMEISTSKLAMRLHSGIELQPTDFYFRIVKAIGAQPAGGQMRANLLQLESLAALANFMPLDAALRQQLDLYAPRGTVANLDAQWQGAFDKLDNFKLKGQFDNLAMRQVGKLPGFSGLSADVDGNESAGSVNIKSHQVTFDAPSELREPLLINSLTGQASWRRKGGELHISLDNAAVSNDDLAGNLNGSFQTKAGTLGILDLTASLTRGDIRRAARYTPLVAVDPAGSDWLNRAILAGHTEDFRMRIKGNLSDFPLDGTEDALLEIGGHAREAIIDFDPNWPRIENASGDFLIRGNQLEVRSMTGTILGAQLQNLSLKVADLSSPELPLEIDGEAVGSSKDFLEFIQRSPVRGYIDGFTDETRASGNAHLNLTARIPLLGSNPVKIAGALQVQANDIDLGDGIPLLRKTTGELNFTESSLQADNVSAVILGGSARLNLRTAEGGVVYATVQGRNNLDALRTSTPHPLLNYLRGGAAWNADISMVKKSAQVVLTSNLQGISSTLPAPFAKRAGEILPLRIEKGNLAEGQDQIAAHLGKLLSVKVSRAENPASKGEMQIKRGLVNFGAPSKWPEREGIWLVGNVPELSLQGWSGLSGGTGNNDSMPIAGANLHIEKISGYGQTFNDIQIDASKRGESLFVKLTGENLTGDATWNAGAFEGNGKLSLRLRNLQLSEKTAAQKNTELLTTVSPDDSEKLRARDLPALEITIDSMQLANKQIGRVEFVGHPDGQGWRMRRLNVTNPDGNLTGDGVWLDADNDNMQLNLQLQISDAGKILNRSGYPNMVKNGSGKMLASLKWPGGPRDFNYANLDGTLKLDTDKGQFLKMEPGIGKLLSVLSLQSLPKRITLDFTDVFSDGFQFDNINGNATIRRGIIDTQDFHIDGSAAKVTMKGSVDLKRETQNLRVVVLPTLGDSVSLLGAFAAGPVVGLGSLVINKVLGNPLDKLISFEYNVSGSWSDPSVVKVGQAPVQKNTTGE